MTLLQEAASWRSPERAELSATPQIGERAPPVPELSTNKPTIISFLRHCGCPVAEANFVQLRTAAAQHPDINFIAVSHSDEAATAKWLDAVGGPGATTDANNNPVTVIVDADRSIYAKWGLGVTPWGHVLNLSAMKNIFLLGWEQGIWNRPTESGSRWQRSGNWAIDSGGIVRWGQAAEKADDFIDVNEAVNSVIGQDP